MELKCYSCEQRDLGTDKESFIWLLSTCKEKDIELRDMTVRGVSGEW